MAELTVNVGDKAPGFCLAAGDANGEEVRLEDYAGQWLVVYFYPRDDTPGCIAEALEFTGLKAEFQALGAAVVGISKDSVAAHRKFAAKHGLTVTLLSDADKAVLTAYGAWREKTSYGKTAMGVVRSTYLLDPQGVVRAAWPKVAKAAGHAAAVLAELRRLKG